MAGLRSSRNSRFLLIVSLITIIFTLITLALIGFARLSRVPFVVFTSDRTGNEDLYAADVERALTHNLTRSEGDENYPARSADGEWIAFSSDRDGDPDLYVMPVVGGASFQLTDNTHTDIHPAWSPDGKGIVFQSDRGGQFDLPDNTFIRSVTSTKDSECPVGLSVSSTQFDVYLLLLPSGRTDRLTRSAVDEKWPSWSPDGTRVVFSTQETIDWTIQWISIDGSEAHRIDDTQHMYDVEPVWSPDGQWIAYSGAVSGTNSDIYVMRADGSDRTRVTRHPQADMNPAWSADGSWIYFESRRDGNWEIYRVRPDGSGLTRVTYDPGEDRNPA